ncbi:Toxoplasma gondii family A protein [Besnoitia besnoiti]|uniref:Toxoplasma gondii family A protein n=1 Tax=Besnoitia besnoiti TaxID=94643 RepID=A0A2A9MMH8_BESBE|nr:Toxoplasma gondii family A protein [Besnoitia besnoiti]PFH36742.1 Toxoplasma gondii family A protein [Besnoitia besnoiti]
MEPLILHALSAVCAAGAALQSTCTLAAELKPDFTGTIPREGVNTEAQKVVWLGASRTLLVEDWAGPIFLPQLDGGSPPDPSLEQMNSVAYVIENGACDFSKTVEYKKLLPDYQAPLWVRTSYGQSGEVVESHASAIAN